MTTMTYNYTGSLTIVECATCHMDFGMTPQLNRDLRDSHKTFYCPAGHAQSYRGRSETEQLKNDLDTVTRQRDAARVARDAARDQTHAAEADAERARARLIRDQHRFANGVCPCCNRTFSNVAAHMRTQHPDYDPGVLHTPAARRYKCSCGRGFDTPRGLAIHQGRNRREDWTDPSKSRYSRHLTAEV